MGLFDKLRPEDMLDYSKRMWETKYKSKYPFHATSPSRIDPSTLEEYLYGRFAAVVMERGVRTWGFEREAARDRFVKLHDARAL